VISNSRQREIIELISQKGNVTVEELAKTFNVSKMTIRRDLEKLQESNLLQRTHGGALVNKVLLHEMAYHEKREENLNVKKCISDAVLEFLEPKQTVYIDAGTTTYEVATRIPDLELTVITNDVRIASHLMLTNNKVIMLGGHILKETGSTIDETAQSELDQFNIDLAIIATSSIDSDMVLCTPDLSRKAIKETALKRSSKSILVTDSSKFYRKSLYKIMPIQAFDVIISDINPEELKDVDLSGTEFIPLNCNIEGEK